MNVRILDVEINGYKGYDVEIISMDATVQDYLDALNYFIDKGQFDRTRAEVSQCEGCDLCCAERIPLTNLDIIRLRQIPAITTANSFGQLLRQYATIEVDAPWVDITLKRDQKGKCLLLYPATSRCSIYQYRPLVCQTFICSPLTERALELRSTIVNLGEDELVRVWLMEGIITGQLQPDKGNADSIKISDYEENAFSGKLAYNEVQLKELCSEKLWTKLT